MNAEIVARLENSFLGLNTDLNDDAGARYMAKAPSFMIESGGEDVRDYALAVRPSRIAHLRLGLRKPEEIMKPFLAALTATTLIACTPIDQASLPKNNFIFAMSNTTARDAVVSAAAANGYRVSRTGEYQVEFDRTAYGFTNSVAFGTGFNSTPNQRISVTLIGSNPTKATAVTGMVSNPGSAHEIFTDMSYLSEGRAEIAKVLRSAGGVPTN